MVVSFSFLGVGVCVTASEPSVVDLVAAEFDCYRVSEKPLVSLQIQCFSDTRVVDDWRKCYSFGKSTLYFGRARRVQLFDGVWIEYDFERRLAQVYSTDTAKLVEAVQLTILSYVGERLEMQRLHRLHGFCVDINGSGVVLLAPSGGGKSTLGFQILIDGCTRLLSDDTPFISETGQVVPFFHRIALREKPDLPDTYLRETARFGYLPKYAVSVRAFASQLGSGAELSWCVLLCRGGAASIEKLPSVAMVWPLLKWLVIGYETPQIWPLFLRFQFKDIVWRVRFLVGRCRAAFKILLRAQVCRLHLSEDAHQNERALKTFLSAQAAGFHRRFQEVN